MQSLLYVGGEDEEGRVWASVMVGEPGFIRSNGPKHLAVAGGAALPSGDLGRTALPRELPGLGADGGPSSPRTVLFKLQIP